MASWKIYKVTDGRRVYIGCTAQSLETRWRAHLYEAKRAHFNTPLHAAIRELGPAAFDLTILGDAYCMEHASWLEQKFIREYDCWEPKGFNKARQPYPKVGGLWALRKLSEHQRDSLR